MNGCQFGGEEDNEDHKHLAAHQELLHVVRLAGGLAQLVGPGVGVPVGLGVLPLELHQRHLNMARCIASRERGSQGVSPTWSPSIRPSQKRRRRKRRRAAQPGMECQKFVFCSMMA